MKMLRETFKIFTKTNYDNKDLMKVLRIDKSQRNDKKRKCKIDQSLKKAPMVAKLVQKESKHHF